MSSHTQEVRQESRPPDLVQRAADRAAHNTALRALAEIIGKVATLVLFAALARAVGQAELGVFVFALAWLQIATLPTSVGIDRYFVRRIATDRSQVREVFSVIGLKLALASLIVLVSIGVLLLLDYGEHTRTVVYLLAPGLLMDTATTALYSVFIGLERGRLLAWGVLAQRLSTAVIGLVALGAGLAVEAVAAGYTIGSAVGLSLCLAFLSRSIEGPRFRVAPGAWRRIAMKSLPFGVQDGFMLLLARFDAVLLSLIATETAVGRYGAAYRIVEATLILSVAINGAVVAMYSYLNRDTTPTLQAVFQRSIKLLLAILVPVALFLGILAAPITEAILGSGFEESTLPLRLLAPTVVLMGVVYLSASLILSRRSPFRLARVTAGLVLLNVVLNLILIPRFADAGAAAAMLATEVVAVTVMLVYAARAAGGLQWGSLLGAPLIGGVMMGLPLAVWQGSPVLAGVVGLGVYVATFVAVERRVAPGDLRFVGLAARRWLGAGAQV